MSRFRTVSLSTFIMSDVQSMNIPSSIRDWYREVKIWAKDRRYSSRLWIQWTRNTKIRTWMHRVLLGTSRKRGRNIKTRCIGSTSILLRRKDWSSIKHDRTPSFFTKHFQLIVFRRLFGWKLEKSYTKKYMRHLDLLRRFPWNMIGRKNWVQKSLYKQKSPNQPDPLFAQKERPVQEIRKWKHVLLVTARTSI